jgi:hypothetical protein
MHGSTMTYVIALRNPRESRFVWRDRVYPMPLSSGATPDAPGAR